MADWSNWSGTVTSHPRETVLVRDVAHLQLLCEESMLAGRRVKAVGAGHSFTGIAEPTDVLVRMDRLSGMRSVDEATDRVWVHAGTPLHVLGPELRRRGLAMTNLGDIDRQTIAGAVSTGTHGTGAGFTGLAGQLTGVELVQADGSLLRVTETENAELLPAVTLSLGALGIVTALQIQCVPKFLLHAVEAPATLDETLDGIDERVDGTDHFEFYWFPHTDRVLTKSNTRLTDPAARAPLPAWRSRLDDDLLSNKLFGALNKATTRAPRIIPAINQVSARALSRREFTDWSYRVFASERDVVFRETEMAIPRAAVPDVLRELRSWLARRVEVVTFPVEVRFAAADELWLSTAHRRESGYIAIHQYAGRDHRRYFEAFWSMLAGLDARPHWGKMHDLGASELRSRYPRFDDFAALRDRLDPQRVFTNPYLDRVLG
ncbi:D-arabinono-1,4-lactone oxidase [Flexivirga oryzae]|uniref:FAD-linked oxidoreductase n=1 Tax=Flexivirga oryzae TaxID=1794944 RepID=A0A839NEI7_9MICO|nr:D-arabinono-1,4-lactone oxidase [Flexivirga oryzae]MBB2894743.1 FAD-linked oxidoreductase [Flexivirga oryzae]